jgi:ankyrin repeat protein
MAVDYDSAEMVSLLLSHGAKSELTFLDNTYISALNYAIYEGKLQVVKLLAEKKFDLEVKENFHFGPLTPLGVAAMRGHADLTRTLLDNGANIDASQGIGTPLFIAANFGNTNVVKVLLELGANTEITETSGTTPLFVASQNGHTDIVKLLLEYGANVNKIIKRLISTDQAKTIVRETFDDLKDQQKQMHAFNEDLDDRTKDRSNSNMYLHMTTLYQATQFNQTDVVQVLLQYGADTEIPYTYIGYRFTPLHTACAFGFTEIAESLLLAGANANCRTETGATPLHLAILERLRDIVELLIKHGADVRATDDNGDMPWDYTWFEDMYTTEERNHIRALVNNNMKLKQQNNHVRNNGP